MPPPNRLCLTASQLDNRQWRTNEVSPILHERPPLLKFSSALVRRSRLALVFVCQNRLAHAVRVICAFLGPGRERRAEAVHSNVPVAHTIEHREHCVLGKLLAV